MNRRGFRLIGLAALITGGLLLIGGVPAFSAVSGERSTSVSLAEDDQAFLEITYPAGDGDRAVVLESEDAEGGTGICRGGPGGECDPFEYEDVVIAEFTDGFLGTLQLETIDLQVLDEDLEGESTVEYEPDDGLGEVWGSFACPAGGGPGQADQLPAAGSVILTATAAATNTTIIFERTIAVECVPG